MVETIDKIRQKISKLLIRIAELENSLKKKDEEHYEFVRSMALNIIEKKDKMDEEFQKNYAQANSDIEKELEKARYDSCIASLTDLLGELKVSQLASPLDTMADFIEVIGTEKHPNKRNGLVVKVLKPGYLLEEELIRSTQVIVVKND